MKSLRFQFRSLRCSSTDLEAIRLRFCRALCDFKSRDFPKGPKIEKIKFRLKFSISLEKSGVARVRLADLNGPKETSLGQYEPKWTILVSRMLNRVRNKVVLIKNGRFDHLVKLGPAHFLTVPRPLLENSI